MIKFWYWELLETARRLLLTAVLSVVSTGSSAQIVFGMVIALIYMKLYGYYKPYDLGEHDIMQVTVRRSLLLPFSPPSFFMADAYIIAPFLPSFLPLTSHHYPSSRS